MTNAQRSTTVLFHPADPRWEESIRRFQGCPTLAATRSGRIYLGWYSGGTKEPHIENYNLLVYSDDQGKTWSKPLLIIPSREAELVHALDIQLWTDPAGRLIVFWVQNDVEIAPAEKPDFGDRPGVVVDSYLFRDFRHNAWMMSCDNPDAEEPQFSAPRRFDQGFLRCKPTVLPDGSWLCFNYDQLTDRYGYSVSRDKGKTFTRYYGGKKIDTPFDEAMAYVRRDNSIRMLARTRSTGELAESVSKDGGVTWTDGAPSGITSPSTRFFIARTPTGRILLVHNDHAKKRTNMTVSLSEDDGATWKYSRCIDTRAGLSYPDADFFGGRIFLTYDRERTGAKEILFTSFTEEDILAGNEIFVQIVSKP